jgi:hypothetical protein
MLLFEWLLTTVTNVRNHSPSNSVTSQNNGNHIILITFTNIQPLEVVITNFVERNVLLLSWMVIEQSLKKKLIHIHSSQLMGHELFPCVL